MKEFAYVYILEFLAPEGEFYVGLTDNPSARRAKHNEGGVPHTAKRRPCQIKTAIVFETAATSDFEKYLKSRSGRAFSKKRL